MEADSFRVLPLLFFLSFVLAGFAFLAPAKADDPALWKFGVGAFDIINGEERAVEFRAEVQGKGLWDTLKPIAGASITTKGSTYGFVGAALDLKLGESFYITPSVAPGIYAKGNGKDLGHFVALRSQIEAGFMFSDSSRIGLAFSHQSNAGLGDNNPGVETVTFTVSIPSTSVGRLFE